MAGLPLGILQQRYGWDGVFVRSDVRIGAKPMHTAVGILQQRYGLDGVFARSTVNVSNRRHNRAASSPAQWEARELGMTWGGVEGGDG